MIPEWAEEVLAKRLQDPNHGFGSYGAVQQWLADTLGVEAEYHAVYQMTRYRLKAKPVYAQSHQRRFRGWLSNRRINLFGVYQVLLRQAVLGWGEHRLL